MSKETLKDKQKRIVNYINIIKNKDKKISELETLISILRLELKKYDNERYKDYLIDKEEEIKKMFCNY